MRKKKQTPAETEPASIEETQATAPAEEAPAETPAETPPAPPPPPPAEEAPKRRRKIWPGDAVRFGDGCPNCGSTRNRIVENYGCTDFGSYGVVERVHECDGDGCGWCFRSAQRVPRQDIPHLGASTQEKRERRKTPAA